MKKTISISVAVLSLILASSAFAKSVGQCEQTAKSAADGYMGEVMDEACANARATVTSASVDDGKITYEIDVVCGPASQPSNHYPHEVVVDENTCNVLSGGPGDA